MIGKDYAVYATQDASSWALVLVTDTDTFALSMAGMFAGKSLDSTVRLIDRMPDGAYAATTDILPGEPVTPPAHAAFVPFERIVFDAPEEIVGPVAVAAAVQNRYVDLMEELGID
jgi:hypothetical protein